MKNITTFMKMAWKTSPAYVLIIILNAFISGGKIILNTILPMFLIDELLGGREVDKLVLYGGIIVLNNVFMSFLSSSIAKYMKVKEEWLQNVMVQQMGQRIMNLEYSYLEDPYYLDLKERAIFAIQNQSAIAMMIKSFADTLQGIVTLLGLVVILITLGPVLIIALAVGVVLMLLFYKLSSGTMVKMTEKIVPINRIYGYYLNVAFDKPAQKDVRLYGMDKMITDRIIKFGEDTCDEFDKAFRGIGFAMGGMSAVSELLSAFTYAYVGIRAVSTMFGPKLSIGPLTMYVSSAITFSSTIISFGQNG